MSSVLNPDGEVLDRQTVRFRRVLPGPIERVWAYLTEADKRAKCGARIEITAAGLVEVACRFGKTEHQQCHGRAGDDHRQHTGRPEQHRRRRRQQINAAADHIVDRQADNFPA